jgi:hypothetical protein
MSGSDSMLEHEVKYVVPAHSVVAVAAFVGGCCRPDAAFARGWVDSIYFDTPGLALYQEKAASDLKKTKVRVRWYDGQGAVFAEVKRRYGTRRAKRRLACDVLSRDLEAVGLEAASLRGVPGLLAARGESLPGGLAPVLRVGYLRQRWICPGGERVSLDREIGASAWAARIGGGGDSRLRGAVLEVKGRGTVLPAVLAPLAALGCRRRSFSKYGFLMAALRGEEMADA